MKRIEICGGIASGKTTLAGVLTKAFSVPPVQEKFRENPFWAAFYGDPGSWVEEKNFCFLVQHTGGIKAAAGEELTVCDYAVFQDLAYASLVQRPRHLELMETLYDHLYTALPPPSLIVALTCPADVLRQRILDRGREQEAGITVEYLEALSQAIQRAQLKYASKVPVVPLASDAVDFANDAGKADCIRGEILRRLDV